MAAINQCQNHNSTSPSAEQGQLREFLCKLEPLRIPRPKCAGMQFVQTSGRQGFYLSLRRKEQKNHTPLSALTFQPPSASGGNSINGGGGDHGNFEHRLSEAASNLSLTNGRHPVDASKNAAGRQPMTKLTA